eukprot:3630769-Pyramimonas_sp.AAC.1
MIPCVVPRLVHSPVSFRLKPLVYIQVVGVVELARAQGETHLGPHRRPCVQPLICATHAELCVANSS